jgi:hypothetical protein
MKTCKTCEHWKNEQALLEYDKSSGFCVSPNLHFTTDKGCSVTVFDNENPSKKYRSVHSYEAIYERKVCESRYSLVTDEKFGCINYKEKGEKK